jgi:molybdenum cofactor cytidylyltransferase
VPERAHVAVVLAAGGSRRLGFPKQRLRRDGETLVARAVRLAQATAPRRVLLVLGANAGELRAALAEAAGSDKDDVGACDVLENPAWSDGLSSSLRCAALALAGDDAPVLLLGCDQPALESHHLESLLVLAAAAESGCAATRYDDALGLPALVTAALLQQATTLSGDRGLRGPLNALGRDRVGALHAPELALDLDTVDDVQRAIASGLLDPLPSAR